MSVNYGSIRIKKKKKFKRVLRHLLHYFAASNEVKADVVKQFNSTLQSEMRGILQPTTLSAALTC